MAYSIPYEYFDEGQQADEYKARKNKEQRDAKIKDASREINRYKDTESAGTVGYKKKGYLDEKDLDRAIGSAVKTVDDEITREKMGKKPLSNKERRHAMDARNRHMRRHPDQYRESYGIFENVMFLGEE